MLAIAEDYFNSSQSALASAGYRFVMTYNCKNIGMSVFLYMHLSGLDRVMAKGI